MGPKSGYWKLIDDAAKRSDFHPSLGFWKEIWPVIVGEELSRRSSPCGWHGATLIVEVEPGPWRRALEGARSVITTRLMALPWEVEALELQDGVFDSRSGHLDVRRDIEGLELPDDAAELLAEAGLDQEIAELAGRIRRHLEWEKKVGGNG